MSEGLASQSVGPVTVPDPYAKFKAEPDSSKWNSATKREYNQLVQDAYADGFNSGKVKTCENAGGGVTRNKCDCQHCSGARAAFAKQVEVTGYDPKPDLEKKGF